MGGGVDPVGAVKTPLRRLYVPDMFRVVDVQRLLDETPWVQRTEARLECFFSNKPRQYTYGAGPGARTYTSLPMGMEGELGYGCVVVTMLLRILNAAAGTLSDTATCLAPVRAYGASYNVCFLNRYDHARQHLGWHADDSPEMDHDHGIAVVSFGAPREIWFREKGTTGIVPAMHRMLLGHGSLLVMPPGFQRTWEHRIPKSDRECGPRVSLTYRHFLDLE